MDIVFGVPNVVLSKKDQNELKEAIKKVRAVKVPKDSYFSGFKTKKETISYKIFNIKNKGNNEWKIIAKNKKNAIKIAMKFKMAKKVENLIVEDITVEYLSYHKVKIPCIEGLMALELSGKKEKLIVIKD